MLGHDDLLESAALATLESMAPQYPSSRIIIAAPLLIDAQGHPLEKQEGVLRQFKLVKTLSSSAFLDLMVNGMVCAPTGMFFARCLIDEFGGFRHEFRGCVDYEFTMRVCAGSNITILPKQISSYRIHENQDVTSYVLDLEDDPELLLECVRQYRHMSDIQIALLVQNTIQSLCRTVRFRFEHSAFFCFELLTYRRSVEARIAKWQQDPEIAKYMPSHYPNTPVSRILWHTHSTLLGVFLLLSLSRIAKRYQRSRKRAMPN